MISGVAPSVLQVFGLHRQAGGTGGVRDPGSSNSVCLGAAGVPLLMLAIHLVHPPAIMACHVVAVWLGLLWRLAVQLQMCDGPLPRPGTLAVSVLLFVGRGGMPWQVDLLPGSGACALPRLLPYAVQPRVRLCCCLARSNLAVWSGQAPQL